jgi:hypothetical protein
MKRTGSSRQTGRKTPTGRVKGGTRARARKRKASGRSNDGGSWALLGFLYQLLGSAAVSLQRRSVRPGDINADFIHIEHHGQDLVGSSPGLINLVQFKYSDAEREIGPAELANILKVFERSAGQVDGRTIWTLKTNRPLSRTAVDFRRGRIPKRGRDRKHAITIRKLNRRFRFDRSDLSHFYNDLMRRARDFGVDDLHRVPQRVVGYLHDVASKPEGRRTCVAVGRLVRTYPPLRYAARSAALCRSV